jgi:excisionase family DNA binding protein
MYTNKVGSRPDSLVYSVPEAGRLLGFSRVTAYELVKRGKIPVLRFGKCMRVPKKFIDELLASGISAERGE